MQALRIALFVSATLALLAIAYLAFVSAQSARAITAAAVKAENALAASAAALPGIADERLAEIQFHVLQLVDAHAKRIEVLARNAVNTTDARLASVQAVAAAQLGELNLSVSMATKALPPALGELNRSVASVAADVHSVSAPTASVVAQLDDSAPLYLNCDHNPDCVFNRYVGVSVAVEKTMQAVAKAAPQVADSTVRIEQDVRREADALTKPRRWWQKLESWLTLAGIAAAKTL